MSFLLTPGAWVRHPDRPDWGLGQVQTVVDRKVTCNFEEAGKRVINTAIVPLEVLTEADLDAFLAARGD